MDFFSILIVALFIGVFIGLGIWIKWYNENRWLPKQKLKLMKEGPLVALGKWGFKPTYQAFTGELVGSAAKVPVAFIGTMRGYSVEASFGWANENYLQIRVFFEPLSRNYDSIMQEWREQQALVKQWKFGNGFFNPVTLFCAPAYIDATLFYVNSPPEASKLIKLAEQITEKLQELRQPSLNYETACELANSVLRESKLRTENKKAVMR